MATTSLPLLTFGSAEPGTDLGSIEYEMTAEKIAMFRSATGDPGARYPTIATKDFYYLLQNRFRVGLMLHAKHEATYLEPPEPGTRVVVEGEVSDRHLRRGRGFVVVETRSLEPGGRLLVRSRTTFLPLDGQDALPPGMTEREAPTAAEPREVGAGGHHPGDEAGPLRRQLTVERMEAWERCSEAVVERPRRESIHVNQGLATEAGQERPVASGLHTVAHLGHLLRDSLGDAWTFGGHLAVTHVRPLHAGDELVARARVLGVVDSREGDRLQLRAWCEDAAGNPSTVGLADVAVSALA